MIKYCWPLISIVIFPCYAIDTDEQLLSLSEQELFFNSQKISIKGKSFQFGNLSSESPDFYGIYRIGADLIQNTIRKAQKDTPVPLGVIDIDFDTTLPFLEGKLKQNNVFSDKPYSGIGSHGTHILGTICASGCGIAANCPLVISLADGFGQDYGSGPDKDHALLVDRQYFDKMLDFLCINNTRVVSRSMGNKHKFESKIIVDKIIDFNVKSGAIFVNAAGNNGKEFTKPHFESLDKKHFLVIANINRLNLLEENSNFGNAIFICAPGTDILSTTKSLTVGIDQTPIYLENLTGTSQATPHVSGTIVAMLAVNPYLSNDEIVEILKATANNKFGKQRSLRYGYGNLNTYGAVKLAKYLSIDNDFELSLKKLNEQSKKYLNLAINSLKASDSPNETEILKIENWLRKAFLSDTNDFRALQALFIFQKNFGYTEEAHALAIDHFFKAENMIFCRELPVEKKKKLIQEFAKAQSYYSNYHDLFASLENDLMEHQHLCKGNLDKATSGDFEDLYKDIEKIDVSSLKDIAKQAIIHKNVHALKFILDADTHDYANKMDKFHPIEDLFVTAAENLHIETLNILLSRMDEKNRDIGKKIILEKIVGLEDGINIIKEIINLEAFSIGDLPLPINPEKYNKNVLRFLFEKNIKLHQNFLKEISFYMMGLGGVSVNFKYKELLLKYIEESYEQNDDDEKYSWLRIAASKGYVNIVDILCKKTGISVIKKVSEIHSLKAEIKNVLDKNIITSARS